MVNNTCHDLIGLIIIYDNSFLIIHIWQVDVALNEHISKKLMKGLAVKIV